MSVARLTNRPIRIPIIGSPISAGSPAPTNDQVAEIIDLEQLLQPNPSSTLAFRVKGNSMEGANIPDGCLAIVDRSIRPTSGSIVVAILNGEFTVKRLVKAGRNMVLHPENPNYRPTVITEEMDFQVWGVVTRVIVEMK